MNSDLPRPTQLNHGLLALLFSILVHGFFLFLLLGVFFPQLRKPVKPTHPTLTFDVVEAPVPSQKDQGIRTQPKKSVQAKPKSSFNLGSLGVAVPGLGTGPSLAKKEIQKNLEEEEGQWGGSEGFRGGSGEKAALDPNYAMYQYFYQKIESALTYPVELRNAGFQSTVVAQLSFDENGNYLREKSRFQSPDPYLRVHVIRTLRYVLSDRIPSSLNHFKRPFTINGSFRFYITQHGDQDLYKAQKFIVGNQLFFFRGFYKSKLEWEIGPFQGLGVFAAAMNPLWFLEKGKEALSKKAKIDPLDIYRDDPDW